MPAAVPAHVEVALSQDGVLEVPENRGAMVATYLAHVSAGPGYPWCAAFVSWVLSEAGATTPAIRDARSQQFIIERTAENVSMTRQDITRRGEELPAGALAIWSYTKWTGHIAISIFQEGTGRSAQLHTIEGNTTCQTPLGEAEGVCQKRRPVVGSKFVAPQHFTMVGYDEGGPS